MTTNPCAPSATRRYSNSFAMDLSGSTGPFHAQLADQGRAILWRDLPCDPGDPATWTQPVIRLDYYSDEPFKRAVNSPVLYAAFDQLVGNRRWRPRPNLGTFPVRFPSPDDPGDAGWHVDLSFPGEDGDPDERKDFGAWRVNVSSKGRALLMLFLFSDVGECDAPTRNRVGSHLDVARLLAPAGEAGMRPSGPGSCGSRTAASPGDGGGRYGLFVPSVPRACRANASRQSAALHGATAAASSGAVET